jgi:zinc/manganese transport system permease protein
MEFLRLMAAPIAMCVVLIGAHVTLGLHVVRRGVIFVDIALAQSSALGAAIGVALGSAVGSPLSWAAGLGLALLAAWIISLTRALSHRLPQEAFIGITYVVAAAASLLVLARLPHGGEEIENLLVGSILWVTWKAVLQTLVLYAALGVLFLLVRNKVERLTADPEAARAAGMRIAWWDFVFYAIIGIVVTRSVQVAGVFLVFTFLVVPAVISILLGVRHRLPVGWALGTIVSAVGAALSYAMDLPTGATIVCVFGLTLLLVATGVALRDARHRPSAVDTPNPDRFRSTVSQSTGGV